MQRAHDEARIHEVEHGVLVAADVHVDRQPVPGAIRVQRTIREVRRRVAQEVPARVEEVVADVGFPPGRLAALWTGHIDPGLALGEGGDARADGAEVLDRGEEDGKVFVGHAHWAVDGTVDDGKRRPPVPLPRDDPVPQAVLHVCGAGTAPLQHLDDARPALEGRRPVERAGVDHRPLARPCGGGDVSTGDDLDDGEVMGPGKLPVAVSTRTLSAARHRARPSARLTRQTVPCSSVSSAVPSPRTTADGYMVLPGNLQRTAPVAASSASEPDTVATITVPPPSTAALSQPLYRATRCWSPETIGQDQACRPVSTSCARA